MVCKNKECCVKPVADNPRKSDEETDMVEHLSGSVRILYAMFFIIIPPTLTEDFLFIKPIKQISFTRPKILDQLKYLDGIEIVGSLHNRKENRKCIIHVLMHYNLELPCGH